MRLNVAVQVAIHLKYCFASLDKYRIEPREIKDPDSTVEPSSSIQLPKRAEYLGVLKANKKSRKLDDEPHDWSCPTEAIVSCHGGNATSVGGMDVTDQDMTCADACGTLCCNGDGACDDFHGNVCKDGMSCNGDGACEGAHVDYVYNGCYGEKSCELANIREVDGGCFHKDSCFKAGYSGDGYVEFIKDACIGVESCKRMGGHNQTIVEGCRGKEACKYLAEFGSMSSNGSNGFIENGCWGRDACRKVARDGGSIGFLKNACKGDFSCEFAAYGGYIGYILDSCFQKNSCTRGALNGGNITFIKSSCNGYEACIRAADGQRGRFPSFINGFNNSCNNESACENIAFDGGVIPEGLNNCCNGAGQCEDVENQDLAPAPVPELPEECSA